MSGLALFSSIAALVLAGCQPPSALSNVTFVRSPNFILSPTRALAVLPVDVSAAPDTRNFGQTPDPATPAPAGGDSDVVQRGPVVAGPTPAPSTLATSAGGGGSRSGTPAGVSGTQPPTDAPSSPPTAPPPAPPQPADCVACPSGARGGLVLAAEAPFGPLEGVTVRAGATTVTTNADGSFTLRIFGAQPDRAPAATAWAYQLNGEGDAAALGLTSAAMTPGAVLGDIPLAIAAGQVALTAPVTWSFPGTRGWELAMITPPARLRIVAAQEDGLRAVSGLRALRLVGSPTMYASWQGEAP